MVAPQTSRGWAPDEVAAFVKFLQGRLSLDPARLYVTGHSMGGSGALHAATTGVFAACAAVAPAGGARPRDLMQVPVWAFHGRNDVIVPAAISERLITAMHRAGASPDQARLTLYDEAPTPPGWPSSVGHASTIPAYSDPEGARGCCGIGSPARNFILFACPCWHRRVAAPHAREPQKTRQQKTASPLGAAGP